MKLADILIVLGTIAVAFFSFCLLGEQAAPVAADTFSLVDQDLFSKEVQVPTGDKVVFRGIRVGATLEYVVDTLGRPDVNNAFEGGIINLEYQLGYGKSVAIFNFQDDVLLRMTLHEPMDKEFATSFNASKRRIYDTFGVPAKQTPVRRDFWVYEYPDHGIDVIIAEKEVFGLSFYAPK